MQEWFKILGWTILAGVIGVVVFVRPSELGGESGGEQASKIINSTAKGFASIINAATGKTVS